MTKRILVLVAIAMLTCVGLSASFGGEQPATDRSIQLISKVVPINLDWFNLPDTFWVPIWFANNLVDEDVAGFHIRVESTRPDMIRFDVDSTWWIVDSLCLSYDGDLCTLWQYDTLMQVGNVPLESANSITEDWDFVQTYSPNGDGAAVEISGYTSGAGFPGGFDTLLKVRAYTTDLLTDSIGDTLQANIAFDPGRTSFTNSAGDYIGCSIVELLVDTTFENCLEWDGASCTSWGDTTVDSTYHCVLDPALVLLIDGNVEPYVCDCTPGDANADAIVNITDAVCMIQHIFAGGPPPDPYPICSGDVNCDCVFNITDAVTMVRIIFLWPDYVPCTCEEWLAHCGPPLR